MKNIISLGNYEMIIKPTEQYSNSVIGSCIPFPWEKFFPPIWKGFLKGQELAKKGTASAYPYSAKELAARIQKSTLPGLAKAESQKEVDILMKEVYFAYPEAQELVKKLEDEAGGSEDVQGLVWVPWVIAAVVVYAIAYVAGFKEGSKDEDEDEEK